MLSPEFRLSVGVPIHNEEQTLPELLRRIGSVLDGLAGGPHQILIVDDGSWDRTPELLEEAARQDPRLTVVSLSRRFGHQAALSAALDLVSGDAVVLMDGDLQDTPEAIPAFVAKFEEGYDVVYATRARRKEGWGLRFCFFLFYRLQARLAEINLPLDAGDFGLMSRRVVEQLRRLREHGRYLRGLRSWVGFRQTSVPVDHPERRLGKSKYGLMQRVKFASDGVLAFSVLPLRAATLLGTMAAGLSGLSALYVVYAKLFLGRSPQGFTALVLLMTFFFGVLLFFLGIIGEYLGRVYEELKGRPIYVVNNIKHYDGASAADSARSGEPGSADRC
jgi:glycosyltransferase involved in cell wall biosynthesis